MCNERAYQVGDQVIRTKSNMEGIGAKAVLLKRGVGELWKIKSVIGVDTSWLEESFTLAINKLSPVGTISVGSVVQHTSFESKPAVICGDEGEYWRLKDRETDANRRWMKKYCVLEGSIVPEIKGTEADCIIMDELETNNITEEIPMKLKIEDKVLVNGHELTDVNDDYLIDLIQKAEEQIKSYKAIKVESKAIIKKILQLKRDVIRLVSIIDARLL